MKTNAEKSRNAVAQRNLLVPQMQDYDNLGMNQQWVPHLMYFQPRNAEYQSVSTDDLGLRNSTGSKNNESNALLIGGSTAFGIGATSDSATITSRLNTMTSHNWINLGGRAFNSTQEALLIHLLDIKSVRGPIVLLSGINNLTCALMASSYSPIYGAFFQQGMFEQQMKNVVVGNRQLVQLLIAGLLKRFGFGNKATAHPAVDKAEFYSTMLGVFKRDCQYIQMIAKQYGTQATFVMQPFVPWIGKTLSMQETQLFDLLDQANESFTQTIVELTNLRQKYRHDVQEICESVGMRFFDLNDQPELATDEWLFVDRAHLTDLGYDTVAKLLVRDLIS